MFGFYSNDENWRPALPSLLAVEMLTDPPFGIGTRWILGASLVMLQALPRLVEWTVYAPMRWSARRDLASFKKAIERRRKR